MYRTRTVCELRQLVRTYLVVPYEYLYGPRIQLRNVLDSYYSYLYILGQMSNQPGSGLALESRIPGHWQVKPWSNLPVRVLVGLQ